jgi:hypothetical protein
MAEGRPDRTRFTGRLTAPTRRPMDRRNARYFRKLGYRRRYFRFRLEPKIAMGVPPSGRSAFGLTSGNPGLSKKVVGHRFPQAPCNGDWTAPLV